MEYKIIVEKPKKKFGIYAWINEADKIVYVGESCDLNRRLCEHIRSMYGLENSSNINLVNAAKMSGKSFDGVIVYYASNYDKNFECLEKEWLIDETIYMYAFVYSGYRLYNGEKEITYNENGNINYYPQKLIDNEGETRSFLKDNKDEMEEKLYKYCQKKYKDNFDKERIQKKIDEAIQNVELVLKKIRKIKNSKAALNDQNNNYFIIKGGDSKDVNNVCNELSKVYLQKEDVALLELIPKTKEDLINNIKHGNLDKIAVCGFGDYLDQSAITILSTKQYDIRHNTLLVKDEDIYIEKRKETDNGICFWAIGNKSETDDYRRYLSNMETDKSPRYLILPYVQSTLYATSNSGKENERINKQNFNLKEDETLDVFFRRMREYYDEKTTDVQNYLTRNNEKEEVLNYRLENDNFAFGYAWDRKNAKNVTGLKKEYPDYMFPEIIQKVSSTQKGLRNKNSVAFLISEFGYIDVTIDVSAFYRFFSSNTGNTLDKTLRGINNVACAELSDIEGVINYLNSCSGNVDEIKLFIAKIEYPYVVALVNNPIASNKR